jgi:GT2 family glycosyltransferase
MVYVLIPAHNDKQEVLALLQCLERQSYQGCSVVLVDDGSTDGTDKEVASRFPGVTFLRGDGNLWWTGANVLGVNHILCHAKQEDYVLLLNNDLVVDDEYVTCLVRCSENEGRAIVGSTTVDFHDPKRLAAGIRLDRKLNATVNRDKTAIESVESEDSDVLPGRGTLVPIEAFKAVGNFNRWRLPHYGADYEFMVRARRAGFRLLVSHSAKVYAKLNISGLHMPDSARLSISECATLLTSRRSAANLWYYSTYVWMCSEPGWKLRNTLVHGTGLLMETIGKTLVGAPFTAVARLCLKGMRIMRAP